MNTTENIRKSGRYRGRQGLALCLCLFLFSGCMTASKEDFPVFPEMETPEIKTTLSTEATSTTTNESEPIEIIVASTLNQNQLQYLAALYTAKKMQAGIKTPDFSSEYLQNTVPLFSIKSITTEPDGADLDTIQSWDVVPDILYVNELSTLVENDLIQPVTNFLAENALFLPSNLSASTLAPLRIADQLYGIPFRTSAMLLFSNPDILEQAGLQEIPIDLDVEIFQDISVKIFDALTTEVFLDSEEISPEEMNGSPNTTVPDESKQAERMESLYESIYPFYSCTELFAFLPTSFNSKAGWFARENNLFNFTSESFEQSVEFLRNYANEGYSLDHLTQEEKDVMFGEEDPRITGRVAMWIGDSKDLLHWSENGKKTIFLSQIPSSPDQIFSPPSLTSYPLCISSHTKYPSLAADFAAFLALDSDAILYEMQRDEGYFPSIDAEALWTSVFSESEYFDIYLFIRENLRDANYSPITNNKSLYESTGNLLTKYSSALLNKSSDLDSTLSFLQEEAIF